MRRTRFVGIGCSSTADDLPFATGTGTGTGMNIVDCFTYSPYTQYSCLPK